jgi:hypothetical protein
MAALNVIPFPVKEANTFDEAWACRAGQMKKRGDGSEKTRKLWNRHAAKVGQERLLEALRGYLREKEPTYGFCGLSVWLNGEKYDHWLPTQASSLDPSQPKAARAPEPLRASLVLALGEPFVMSYLDPCSFHDDNWITPATEYAKNKLRERGRDLKAAGLVEIRNRE